MIIYQDKTEDRMLRLGKGVTMRAEEVLVKALGSMAVDWRLKNGRVRGPIAELDGL